MIKRSSKSRTNPEGIVTSITRRLTYRINRLYLGMMKNETKSTKKCTQCHAPMFLSDGEQLNAMGFCSWDCVQRSENECNYLEYNGIHR